MEETNEKIEVIDALTQILLDYNIVTAIYYSNNYIEIEYTFENYETSIHRVYDLEELINDMKDVFYEEIKIKL